MQIVLDLGFEAELVMERHQLSEEASFKLQEGIQLLLSQWSSLQVAVENEFGGPDSRRKSQQLPVDLFTWFTQSKGLFIITCRYLCYINVSD